MRKLIAIAMAVSVCAVANASLVEVVQVSLDAERTTFLPGETARVTVRARVVDGAVDNGIRAFAINAALSQSGVFSVDDVELLGAPDPAESSVGALLATEVKNVKGADGGYATDLDRGVPAPFALFNIELTALTPGTVTVSAAKADNALSLGVPEGVKLQWDVPVEVEYLDPLDLAVIPEPAAATMVFVALGLAVRRR